MSRFFSSMNHALRGIKTVFLHERNFRIQLAIAAAVIIAGFALQITRNDFLWTLLMIGGVLTLEIVNSAIEHLLDILRPRLSYQVEAVKDILAGVVFLFSLVAVLIGILIFTPYLVNLIL